MEGVGLEEEERQHLREKRRNINKGITCVQREEQILRSEMLTLQRDIQTTEEKYDTGTENLRGHLKEKKYLCASLFLYFNIKTSDF